MPHVDWKKSFIANIASSYGYIAVRMILGLVLFRIMFSNLDHVQFGFWSLLWSFIGYSALLDFGLGATVEKIIAQKYGDDNIPECNRALSTVFWLFMGFAILFFLLALLIQAPLFALLKVDPENLASFKIAYWWFTGGMAIMLPLAPFISVLDGLQRFYLTNSFRTGGVIINAAAVLAAIYFKLPFSTLVGVAIASTVLPSLIAAFVAFRIVPGLSLHPQNADKSLIKEQISFSTTSYLSRIGTMLLMKGDRFIVSVLLSLGAVVLYEASAKVAMMLTMFAGQLGKQAAPAAAHLHAKGDLTGLSELLLKTSRMLFILVTPCYVVAALFMDPLIRLFTGLEVVPREVFLAGHFLLLSVYLNELVAGAGYPVLVMSGRERNVLAQIIAKLVINISLSLILVRTQGIAGVALATLIANCSVAIFMQLPMSLKVASRPIAQFVHFHLTDLVLPLTVMILTTITILFVIPLPDAYTALDVAWRGLLVVVPVGITSWKTIRDSLRT